MYGRPFICQLNHVEKRYDSRRGPVLGPISFTLNEGEILGIRGANGAGKSTLLNLIAGVIKPDKGEILYGADVKGNIGYVPQELSLYSSLTGTENLKFWGYAEGMPKAAVKARCGWILEKLNLTDKAKVPVSKYSGGMKRRLHLASALMTTPKLLLLDEPTVGADTDSVEIILNLLLHLKSMGASIIISGHHADELERICDRIINL